MTILQKHRWDSTNERRLAGIDSLDGNARNERTCLTCGMTRITVIPPQGFPWHEWRTSTGEVWVGEMTPPCVPRLKDDQVKAAA